MIENFEKRYEKLLQKADEGEIVMLPSVEGRGGYLCQALPVVTSKEDISCADNAFIVNYCL
jgi:hypothetical protein